MAKESKVTNDMTIDEMYNQLLEEQVTKVSNKNIFTSSDIRTSVSELLDQLNKDEITIGIANKMLKTINPELYEKLTYTNVRTSCLYGKTFKLDKRDEGVYIVRE